MSNQQASNSLTSFIQKLESSPESINFEDVMQVISDNYRYQAATFNNGEVVNEAGTNEGSCKIFAFAKLNGLSQAQTLACFGQYYRDDVLKHPQGDDHGNIRNFMKSGWDGINFTSDALTPLS